MLLTEFKTRFPWGVLLISDAASKEEIPSWSTAEDQVAVAKTALVVRVMNGDVGEVTVRVWDHASDAGGNVAYFGRLDVPSRILRISDALGNRTIDVDVPDRGAEVEILTDESSEASQVDVVLSGQNG